MDNNISFISQILNKSVDINDLSLEEYRKNFYLYPSMKEARSKGYVAHHPVPIDIQKREIENKYNIKFPRGDKGRREFMSSSYPYDDSCYRMTNFEHMLDHFLMARELGGEYIKIYDRMRHYTFNSLCPFEQETLENIKDWADMVDKGRKSNSRITKAYFDNMTPEEKEELRALRKKSLSTDEARKHNSEAQIRYNQSLSKEEREQRNLIQKRALTTPEAKKNISRAQKKRFSSMTPEEKEILSQRYRESQRTPESIEKRNNLSKSYWKMKEEGYPYNWQRFKKEYSEGKYHFIWPNELILMNDIPTKEDKVSSVL